MGFFGAARGWRKGGVQKGLLSLKSTHISSNDELGPVILYLNQIQKKYESRDTPLELCWHHIFFIGN